MEAIGTLKLLRRYPVKSMAGEDLDAAFASYAGIVGDRIYAFVDNANRSGFPWMTARQGRDLIRFQPRFVEPPEATAERPETRHCEVVVQTPEGEDFKITDAEFTRYLEKRFGRSLTLRFSERSMHDSKPISLFGLDTVRALSEESQTDVDPKRFRANLYVEWQNRKPFYEDELIGEQLQVGEKFRMAVVKKDSRCLIITLDPATAQPAPAVLETVTRKHKGCAGVYAAVLREGILRVEDRVYLL